MRVIIDGVEYVPVTQQPLGNRLARMLISEFWGTTEGKDDEWVAEMAANLQVSVSDSDDRDDYSRLDAVVARMLEHG